MNCVNHPDREKIAFCQNCGRPLCAECSRAVGAGVFCEPCLEARLRGATGGVVPGAMPGASVPPVPPTFAAGYRFIDPATGMPVPRAFSSHAANPWLAFGLGFIPGVGAMYNEQYAKGVVHLAVFSVLVSLADSHDVFGLFVAGWIFYMAIEAYHTARARRDGLPLPNPFGLNDIGERLGFGRNWGTASTGPAANPAGPTAYAVPPMGTPDASAPAAAAGAATPQAGWSAVPPAYAGYYPPYPPYTPTGAVPPPMATGVPVPGPLDVGVPHPGNRFPVGAIWLIGLGVLFLVGNSGFFHGLLWFSGRTFVPLLLIGFAVWLFFHRMTSGGRSLGDDGYGDYRYRVFRATQGAVFIALTGVLFLLNDFDILSWGHSWPLWIIAAGVLALLRRTTYAPMPVYPYVPPPGAPAVPVYPMAAQPVSEPAATPDAAAPSASVEQSANVEQTDAMDETTHSNGLHSDSHSDREGR